MLSGLKDSGILFPDAIESGDSGKRPGRPMSPVPGTMAEKGISRKWVAREDTAAMPS